MAGPVIPIVAGQILEARVVIFGTSQLGINVLHYRTANLLGASVRLQFAADALDVLFAPLYKPTFNASYSYRGISVRRIVANPSVDNTGVANQGNGTDVGNTLPRQVSGICSKKTASPGPAGRGRAYIPFPTEDHSDPNGIPTAGYLALLNVIAGTIGQVVNVVDGAASLDLIPVILSRTVPGFTTDLTTCIGVQKFATQRRRGQFGRINSAPF